LTALIAGLMIVECKKCYFSRKISLLKYGKPKPTDSLDQLAQQLLLFANLAVLLVLNLNLFLVAPTSHLRRAQAIAFAQSFNI
jgi:hypothetical protein